eukprot:UN1188
MELQSGQGEQKQLVADIARAKDDECKIRQEIEGVQRSAALASDLWRVTKDIFSKGEVANHIVESPAFRFNLLREPIMAIAKCEGYEMLQEQVVSNLASLEKIAQQLQLQHPNFLVDVDDLLIDGLI